MKVLITGVAGFIGSHLADNFLSLGFEVVGIDNLSTGSMDNLLHLEHNPAFHFQIQDVTEPFDFDVDLILNFACPASPKDYQQTPINTLLTNVMGTINCLELSRRRRIRMVHASTSEVYGDPEVSPQAENYLGKVNPIGPRACYDEGKRVAETAIYDYVRVHNLDVRVVRIFNTYGPRMAANDGRVVSNFIVSAITDEPITIYGDGKQTRSFCYISDTISAIEAISLLEMKPLTPINVGNPNEMTMKELSEKIVMLTQSKSIISFHELPIDDPKQRCPDIKLARNVLNWSPKIELEKGLSETIAYYRTIIKK